MSILYDFVKIPQSNASHSTAPFTREPTFAYNFSIRAKPCRIYDKSVKSIY